MIEVEIKVPVADPDYQEGTLMRSGFVKGSLLKETDYYFDSDSGSMRGSGMALRVRRCENMTANTAEDYMTFKGPKMDQISMSRQELEMKIENADTGRKILEAIGYIPVRPVVKIRQYYHKDEITVCLDRVEELGCYMELELIVHSSEQKDGALERIFSLLRELGYEKEDAVNTSYLSLLQRKEK